MDDVRAPASASPQELAAVRPDRCAACGATGGTELLRLSGVPANSCLMLPTAAAARGWPRGEIVLMRCEACGFVANRAADARLTEYSARYEPTQGWSPAFRRYHRELAGRIAAAVPLAGRRVAEIGCGQGEFLHLLCGMAGATGLGFDPCADPRRADVLEARAGGVTVLPRFFDAVAAASLRADLLVCKMTLEHIPAVGRFASLCAQVARNSGPGMRLFVQVPDAARILRDGAFEDIYYEHCNYFTEASLAGLFGRHGFVTEQVFRDYDGQYLGLLARFDGKPRASGDRAAAAALAGLGAGFAAAHARWVARWREAVEQGGRVVIWGSGSKGVAFLGALGSVGATVTHAVDINPHRQGMHMVGTGHPIVAPAALVATRPDTVIVMNRVYLPEVTGMLAGLGLVPRILAL